ncbi:MAG: hypothetical protein Q8N99_06995 [Nanoarchaeota archaeon]|nr:hypothetical protein [Nanoarchaeota archaeon]
MEIERDKLLGILKNLEEQGSIKIVTGKVEFLSYPSSKEKKKPKVSKEKSKGSPNTVASPKEKFEIQTLQEEAEKQKLYTEKLKEEIKKLEQRPPKVITKTIIKEAKPKVITRTIIRDVKPIKIKKEAKIKPKKVTKRSVKLRKKFKTAFGVKKSFRKIGLKIKGGAGMGIFKIKNFIKHLKRR